MFAATVIVVLMVSSQIGFASTSVTGGDWTQFINNYQDTRYQSASSVTSSNVASLKPTWTFLTNNSVTSTPIVYKGVAYFDDWSGYVYAVNVYTGALIWKSQPGVILSGTPSISNNLLYIAGSGGGKPLIAALSPSTGQVVWSEILPATMEQDYASPIFYNGNIYLGLGGCAGYGTNSSCKGEMFALNANTGAVVWTYNTGGSDGGASIWGTVAIDTSSNAIFFGTGYNYAISTTETYPTVSGGAITPFGKYGHEYTGTVTSLGSFGLAYSVISLNAATGALNWADQAYSDKTSAGDVDFGSSPNLFQVTINGVQHNAVGMAAKDGNYYVIDRASGALLQKMQVGLPATQGGGVIGLAGFTNVAPNSPQVFVPGYYGANNTIGCCGVVSELTPSNGKVVWNFTTPGKIIGSVAVVPGAVLFGDFYGNLYALSTTTGTMLFHTVIDGGATTLQGGVTVAEGRVLVGGAFGTTGSSGVYAYDALPATTVTTAATPATVTVGTAASAQTTLSGGTTPTGSIVFSAYTSPTCSASSLVYASPPVTVNGNGVYNSGTYTPTKTGTLYWTSQYSGDPGNNPSSSACAAAGSTQTVSSIPGITKFAYTDSYTGSDPTKGTGTVVFTLAIKNYGTASVTLGGSLAVTSAATVACTGGNTLGLFGTLAAGASSTFTLSCTYSGVTGQAVTGTASATFTDINSLQGTVSGSPATVAYTIET